MAVPTEHLKTQWALAAAAYGLALDADKPPSSLRTCRGSVWLGTSAKISMS